MKSQSHRSFPGEIPKEAPQEAMVGSGDSSAPDKDHDPADCRSLKKLNRSASGKNQNSKGRDSGVFPIFFICTDIDKIEKEIIKFS